jgi:hypothetical protein
MYKSLNCPLPTLDYYVIYGVEFAADLGPKLHTHRGYGEQNGAEKPHPLVEARLQVL